MSETLDQWEKEAQREVEFKCVCNAMTLNKRLIILIDLFKKKDEALSVCLNPIYCDKSEDGYVCRSCKALKLTETLK